MTSEYFKLGDLGAKFVCCGAWFVVIFMFQVVQAGTCLQGCSNGKVEERACHWAARKRFTSDNVSSSPDVIQALL
jgi:hypothetical protein